MTDDLDVAIRHVRTVALWHPTFIRRAPIGMYYLYEDRRIRLRVPDQAGLDDYGVWVPARGDDWATVLLWSPYMAAPGAASGVHPGRLDSLFARVGDVQESAGAGLARRALDSKPGHGKRRGRWQAACRPPGSTSARKARSCTRRRSYENHSCNPLLPNCHYLNGSHMRASA